MSLRYHAARPVSNTWLDRDLQLQNVKMSWALSSPGELTATVDAVTATATDLQGRFVLDEWGTLIYAEENDVLRWAGIVHSTAAGENGSRAITCTSFSGYPNKRLYTDESSTGYKVYVADAFDIIRYIWTWLQSTTNGNLGVTLNNADSGYLMGSEDPGPPPVRSSYPSSQAYLAAKTAWQSRINEPYILAWWNTPNLGEEINNILVESRGEYIESHAWTADKADVTHNITLALNVGSRRDDLRFVEGENVLPAPLPDRNGDEYANYVIALGAGDDRHTLKSTPETIDDGRIRCDAVVAAKGILRPRLLQELARNRANESKDLNRFESIEVIDHPNAPIGSWSLGDQIMIQTHSGFTKLQTWMRITGWTYDEAEPSKATISLTRLT